MAGLLEGAILGAVFGEAKDFVKDFVKSVRKFNPILLEFQANLTSLEPFFDVIKRQDSKQILSQEMERQLLDILKEIRPVVEKCTDNNFSLREKAKYAKKLQELDTKLRRFFKLNGQAMLLVDNVAILDKLKELERRYDQSERRFDQVMKNFMINVEPMHHPPDLPAHKIVGLRKPIEKLKEMVIDDDSCRLVVITALPGSGKTTLATMFCNDPRIKEKFGNIFFETVSSELKLKSLEKLANTIKETEEDRDTLLVLDDVWPNDGESIIKIFDFVKPGYKILVTSRSSLPTLDGIRVYELEKLSEEDAEAVFCDAANPDPELDVDKYVKKIVNRCRESPLVLRMIGASLKGKPKPSWKTKVREWPKEVRAVAKKIVDSLDAEEKECYLDLGSFPEDQWIPATALRDIWVEKYGYDEKGANTLNYLYELSTRNLIDFKLSRKDVSKIEGSSHDHYVQQHDLLRDLAIDISSWDREEERTRMITNIHKNKLPHWWDQQKNLDKAELVSISTDEDFSSEWKDLHAPKVKVLVLNSRNDYALPDFLNKMDQLRVIVITNYGFSHAQLDNTQVLTKLPNLRRIRFKSFSITSIPKMAKLEKLSLIMCKFGDAFADGANDMASLLPKLVEFEINQPSDLKILPNTLCNITGLKRLGITYCQELVELPEELGKLTNLNALRLHSCTKLKELPDSLCDLQNLKHLDITDCYAMDKLPERMGELGSLKSLHMRCCGGPWGLTNLPTSVKNLKSLKKVICSEQTAPGWRSVEDLTSLKSIVVPEEDFMRSFSRIMGQHL